MCNIVLLCLHFKTIIIKTEESHNKIGYKNKIKLCPIREAVAQCVLQQLDKSVM